MSCPVSRDTWRTWWRWPPLAGDEAPARATAPPASSSVTAAPRIKDLGMVTSSGRDGGAASPTTTWWCSTAASAHAPAPARTMSGHAGSPPSESAWLSVSGAP